QGGRGARRRHRLPEGPGEGHRTREDARRSSRNPHLRRGRMAGSERRDRERRSLDGGVPALALQSAPLFFFTMIGTIRSPQYPFSEWKRLTRCSSMERPWLTQFITASFVLWSSFARIRRADSCSGDNELAASSTLSFS